MKSKQINIPRFIYFPPNHNEIIWVVCIFIGKILFQVYCYFSKLQLIFFVYILNTSMISSVTQF